MNVRNIILLLVVMVSVLVGGCDYNWIYEDIPVVNPDEPVSFAQDIVPIFSAKNCTACHDGSPAPDLREANAYTSINNASYLNRTAPEESSIYTKAHPNGSHSVKYSVAQAALILTWIEQGAENN